MQLKKKDDDAFEAIQNWEQTGEVPAVELLGRLTVIEKEVPLLH